MSCGSSSFSPIMELCKSHCGQEVRNGTPTLIPHVAARASPSLANPADGSSGSSVPLPVRGLTDTGDLSWPTEQPQMCCSLAWQCTVYLQASPTQFRMGRCSWRRRMFYHFQVTHHHSVGLFLHIFPLGPKSPLCLLSNFFIEDIFLTFNLYCLSLNPAPHLYVFSGDKRIKRQYSRCKWTLVWFSGTLIFSFICPLVNVNILFAYSTTTEQWTDVSRNYYNPNILLLSEPRAHNLICEVQNIFPAVNITSHLATLNLISCFIAHLLSLIISFGRPLFSLAWVPQCHLETVLPLSQTAW